MNQRPTLVLVRARMASPTRLGDIRHRAGALTATTPAIGVPRPDGDPGELASDVAGADRGPSAIEATWQKTAMAPMETPTSTTGWPPSAASAAAAATSRRSSPPTVQLPSEVP